MRELSQISGKDLVKALQRIGFRVVSQRGSHIKLRKLEPKRLTVIIPCHKAIRPGTLNNILRIAEISKKDLKALLK